MKIRSPSHFRRLMAEDLTLKAVNDSENGQTLLYGMGDQHLDDRSRKTAKTVTKWKSN